VAEHTTKHRPGRKTEFSPDHLRDIWLFVETGRSRYKQSAYAFCNRARFEWISVEKAGTHITKTIDKATLRRRYQQAVALLRAEAALYRRIAEFKRLPKSEDAISPLEKWWRKLLDERIGAELSGNAPRK
jgi:hypothetical protein